MRIVKQSVELLEISEDGAKGIEEAGRTCYKSESKTSADSAAAFVKMLGERGHNAMLEFGWARFRFVTDRGISHEIVRHRLASYCLAGDTEVVAYTNKKGRSPKRWTLAQLYAWSKDPKRKGRLKLIRLRSVDDRGVLIPGRIKSIVQSGIQQTYTLRLKSGRRLRPTMRHRILTPSGYKTLGELIPGDRVLSNGLPGYANKEWIEKRYIGERMTRPEVAALLGISDSLLGKIIQRMGIKKPPSLRKNRRPGYGIPGMHGDTGREAISHRMTGGGNHRWRGEKASAQAGRYRAIRMHKAEKCWGCGSTKNVGRHHLDENTHNNEEENILPLCDPCHKAFHVGPAVLTVFSDEVVSIEPHGLEMTYDVEMADRPHNFVANGVVVHNSQESSRYCNYSKKKFGKEISVVAPWGIHEDNPDGSWDVWRMSMLRAEKAYFDLLDTGHKPQIARSVLPTCLKTEIVMQANFREWLHFLYLRHSPFAHPDMQTLAAKVGIILVRECPAVFEGYARKGA